jgi:KRAB domain-containing zinc finger protein
MIDFSLRRSIIISQFVEKIAEYDPLKRYSEIKPFSCNFSDKSFLQVNEVKEHIKIHNSISEVEDLRKQLKSLKTQVEELQMKLKNSQSKLVSQTTKQKNKLQEKFKRKPSEQPDSEVSMASKVAKKEYRCGSCEKTFTFTFTLKRHEKIHETRSGTNEVIKGFNCHICDKDFITEEYVQVHIKRVHDEKQHKCNLCDYETSLKAVHEGKKPCNCTTCDKCFS